MIEPGKQAQKNAFIIMIIGMKKAKSILNNN